MTESFGKISVALHDGGDHPLLVDHVLAHQHGVLLQLVDIQEELLVDILAGTDLLAVGVYLLGHELDHVGVEVELDHVGVEVDSVLHDTDKDVIACGIKPAVDLYPALYVREAAQLYVSDGYDDTLAENERDSLHRILVRAGNQEVGVDGDSRLGLGVAG